MKASVQTTSSPWILRAASCGGSSIVGAVEHSFPGRPGAHPWQLVLRAGIVTVQDHVPGRESWDEPDANPMQINYCSYPVARQGFGRCYPARFENSVGSPSRIRGDGCSRTSSRPRMALFHVRDSVRVGWPCRHGWRRGTAGCPDSAAVSFQLESALLQMPSAIAN
jgi:hypothetical protein